MQRRRHLKNIIFPWLMFFLFFFSLGALFVALPSTRTPYLSTNDDYSFESSQLVAFVSVADDPASFKSAFLSKQGELGYVDFPSGNDMQQPQEMAVATAIQPPDLEKLILSYANREEKAESYPEECKPPTLEPGIELPPSGDMASVCLHRSGNNPISIEVLQVLDGEDHRINYTRSFIVASPTMKSFARHINCSYSVIIPVDDFQVRFGEIVRLQPLPALCPVELFNISCTYPDPLRSTDTFNKMVTFESVFRCVHPKTIRQAIPYIQAKKGRFEEKLNIIMIGLDSLARVTWLEQLPKTSSFFKETLGGLILEGYNIVGDGTTVALTALLTGHFYNELHESRRGFPNASTIDDFPFLWTQLKTRENYVTLYDEDQPTIGTFQHRMMGFERKPVDYYGRWFQLAYREKAPRSFDCLGSLPSFEEMISQIKSMYSFHPDPQRKFAMLFNGAHSRPSFDGTQDVTQLDNLMHSTIQKLSESNLLNNTLLILFSDHGARNGKLRATPRGKLEERMPFFGMAFPKWWHLKYPKEATNLKEAIHKMTTPFDLHRTLQQVGGLDAYDDYNSHAVSARRGLSLFDPLPDRRTCEEAGVLPHWCSCGLKRVRKVDENSAETELPPQLPYGIPPEALLAAFKKHSDKALRPVADLCEALVPRDPFITEVISPDYVQMSFWTSPGNGQWEVTFKISPRNQVTVADSSQISRTNSYGTAPLCIARTHPHLREFCYCKVIPRQEDKRDH